ncbi:hypothetical protein B7463_g8751, partial [Scytalidium lignicola]
MAISDAVQTLLAAFFLSWHSINCSVGIIIFELWAIWRDCLQGRPEAGPRGFPGRRYVLVGLRVRESPIADCYDYLPGLPGLFNTVRSTCASSSGTGSLVGGLQAVVALRFVAGIIFVAFTRPQFAPTCVARTSVLPISIVTIGLDAVILGGLLVRALYQSLRKDPSSDKESGSWGLLLSVMGLTVWMGTSIPMVLGVHSIILLFRTTIPAIGLLLLVVVLISCSEAVLSLKDGQSIIPEARSPFVTPSPRGREIAGSGTPTTGHRYTGSGTLYVVNPSLTPGESPMPALQSNHGKRFSKYDNVKSRGAEEDRQNYLTPNYMSGRRASSGIFPLAAPTTDPRNLTGNVSMLSPAHTGVSRSVPVTSSLGQTQDKKSRFGWSKTPKKSTVRGLGISHPVTVDQDRSAAPFTKIHTVDLDTAATMERERREAARTRTSLVASRPAPAPPAMTPEEALKRSISIRRKEAPVYTRDLTATISSPSVSSQLAVPNGSSTSASLSPGGEDIRRRSPRNLTAFNPQLGSLNKQKRFNFGLPANPRSQMISMAWETPLVRESVVMPVHDLVYNNPEMVKNLSNGTTQRGASVKYGKSGRIPEEQQSNGFKSSTSVIHRPRPVRRHTETERIIFPADGSPIHRRSKSSGHAMSRKSVFSSYPGSPSQLPELPRPPTSASELKRLLPNNTKSMTFDEKMQLLFPAPPGTAYVHKRRSSVPSIPRISSPFLSFEKGANLPVNDDERRSHRSSKRSTIASFDPQTFSEVTKSEVSKLKEPEISHFSTTTYRSVVDDVVDTSLPRMSKNTARDLSARKSARARQTQYDMRKSAFTDAASSDMSPPESMTNWGSVHSAVPPFDISKATQTARETFIRARDKSNAQVNRQKPPSPSTSETKSVEGYMTVMLDTSDAPMPVASETSNPWKSSMPDASQALPVGTKLPIRDARGGYFRVGDEVPTFSERRRERKSRKMPPPTPLLLKSTTYTRQATVVVRQAEPSPPLESPEQARQEIETQLKHFETTDRISVGSMIRHMPEIDSKNSRYSNVTVADRLRLLENLEKEVGQQESQWQQLHCNLDRDSTSTVATTYTPVASMPPNRSNSSSPSSTRGSQRSKSSTRTPPRVVSRRERIRNGLARRLSTSSQESVSKQSSQGSNNSRASTWQQRLAEAQTEYSENTNTLLTKRDLKFLMMNRVEAHMALGSPTPPDSEHSEDGDNETDFETEVEHKEPQFLKTAAKVSQPTLWQQTVAPQVYAKGLLWTPSQSVTAKRVSFIPQPKTFHRRLDKGDELQPLTSFSLWVKPSSVNKRPLVGLWGSKPSRPKSIVTRPVTHRPPRRSRRVTILPDIVESPVPLPNNRDTLGIFQFPWGETSDSVVYQPPVNLALPPIAAQAVPMDIASRLNARSKELEPEDETEYSSSFFDDYDEEDAELDQYAASESEDDFDETTLWEIASLLKTTELPSRNSLIFSGKAVNIIEDYDDESDYESGKEEEQDDEVLQPKTYEMKLPIQPLAPIKSPRLPSMSLLWTPIVRSSTNAETGLFNPAVKRDDYRYTALSPAALNINRKPHSISAPLPSLTSTTLWDGPLTLPAERDWVSESSVRPSSPSIYSPSSSGRTSPISEIDASDASSITSTSTKASSLWSSISSAAAKKMPSWLDRKKGAKAADVDHSAKAPTRKPSISTLPALRESRVFDSNDLWESGGAISSKKEESRYDSSVCHPVFFTEALVSDAVEVHPAAIGHVVWSRAQSKEIKLWSLDNLGRGAFGATSSLLWSKQPSTKQETGDVDFRGHQIVRKVRTRSPSVLPALISASLFIPTAKSATSKNWLASTSQRQSSPANIWTPTYPVTKASEVSLLWSRVVSTKPKDSYADFEGHEIARRARTQQSSILEPTFSKELFKPTPQSESKNWLMVTSQRQHAPVKTWSPSSPTETSKADASFLWSTSSSTEQKDNHADFAGHETIRRARTQGSIEVSIVSAELFKPSQTSSVPKNWLIATSHRRQLSPAMMWSPLPTADSAQENGSFLWSKRSMSKESVADFEGHEMTRRARIQESLEVLPLAPTTLFNLAPKTESKNWLAVTSKPMGSQPQFLAKTWTPPSPSSASSTSASSLWSREGTTKVETNDSYFSGHEIPRRARPEHSPMLPVLTSTELFRQTPESITSRDWLTTTSNLAAAQR